MPCEYGGFRTSFNSNCVLLVSESIDLFASSSSSSSSSSSCCKTAAAAAAWCRSDSTDKPSPGCVNRELEWWRMGGEGISRMHRQATAAGAAGECATAAAAWLHSEHRSREGPPPLPPGRHSPVPSNEGKLHFLIVVRPFSRQLLRHARTPQFRFRGLK